MDNNLHVKDQLFYSELQSNKHRALINHSKLYFMKAVYFQYLFFPFITAQVTEK